MHEPAAAKRRTIPIAASGADAALAACGGAEPFALMVLGDSMLPEFEEGDVIVIEPEGLATDGAFVLARVGDEWTFRQLVAGAGAWRLEALNRRYAAVDLPDLAAVRGVIIQKSRPGRRRSTKRYGA